MNNNIDKNALKVQALTQRISELVSQYENSYADLRVEYTLEVNDRDEKIKTLEATVSQLQATLEAANENVAEEDPDTSAEG